MYNVITGDVLDVLPTVPDASIDAVLCDPPYGLSDHRHVDVVACLTAWLTGQAYRPRKRGFMGRGWDAWVPGPECWREVLRVLRPGGHALVFAGTRSMDLMTMALRLAGFEIRECVRDMHGRDHYPCWLYSQGMGKGLNIGKAIDDAATTSPDTEAAQVWEGYNTGTRPAWEPVIVARKPLDGTVAHNAVKHGTGGLNIDACRIPTSGIEPNARTGKQGSKAPGYGGGFGRAERGWDGSSGRYPTNVIHDGSDEVMAEFAELGTLSSGKPRGVRKARHHWSSVERGTPVTGIGDSGTAARFFYAAKASGNDRWFLCTVCGSAHPRREREACQHGLKGSEHIIQHPTVKPTSLTEYLARLIMPPAGIGRPRRILVPFAGSGSEMVGALRAGWDEVVGIEMDADYAAIAAARCEVAKAVPPPKKAGGSKADAAPAPAHETPVASDLFSTAAE